MHTHFFIFKPGVWIGEGKLSFSKQELRFFTKWTISNKEAGVIHAFQQVEMENSSEQVRNHFCFSQITETTFAIELDYEGKGLIQGKGMIDPIKIGWEFNLEDFDGLEIYSLVPEKEGYALHAEYTLASQFSSVINGRIWQKIS